MNKSKLKNTFVAEYQLGVAIGKMYIAAQHLNQTASNAACDALQGASKQTKRGFNSVLEQSEYHIRAQYYDNE